MMFLLRRPGMKVIRSGTCDSLDMAQGGGWKESGGVVRKLRSRPLDMMEVAVGSPRASHSEVCWEFRSNHLSSSESPCPLISPLGDENSCQGWQQGDRQTVAAVEHMLQGKSSYN